MDARHKAGHDVERARSARAKPATPCAGPPARRCPTAARSRRSRPARLAGSRSPIPPAAAAASSSCTHSATVVSPSRLARSISVRTKARSSSERIRFCTIGAVDLQDVDAELAQVAERRVARAEIVDRDPAAEILHARDEAAGVVDVVDRRHLGDLDREPLGDAAMRAQQRGERRPPVRIGGRGRRHVDAGMQRRHRGHLADQQFEHAMIEQPHEAEPLGDRE